MLFTFTKSSGGPLVPVGMQVGGGGCPPPTSAPHAIRAPELPRVPAEVPPPSLSSLLLLY